MKDLIDVFSHVEYFHGYKYAIFNVLNKKGLLITKKYVFLNAEG